MTTANKNETPTQFKDFLLDRAMRDINAEDEATTESSSPRKRRARKSEPSKRKYTRLTPEQKDQVLNKLLAGDAAKDVATEFGISLSTADNMRREYRRLCTFARVWRQNSRPASNVNEHIPITKETQQEKQVV